MTEKPLREITVKIGCKPVVEHRKDRIRFDTTPACTSLIVEKDGRIHD